MVEEGGMRSPVPASLGAERGLSVPVNFCSIWQRSHGRWLGGGGGRDEVPSPGLSRRQEGPQCACDFLFHVAAFSWQVARWCRRGDEVPSPCLSRRREGPLCACDFLFLVAKFSWRLMRWWRRGG